VFRAFRRFLAVTERIEDCLRSLTASLEQLVVAQQAHGPAMERLEALELARHQWEAACEGLLLKAEGKLRAANNAEARERALKKTYEHLIDPFPEDGQRPEAVAPDPGGNDDAARGETEGVQPVRLDVAPTNKTLAQRAKFGVR